MPPLIALLAETLNDLPLPPGVTPAATAPATQIVSPAVSPAASPLVETTAVPATTPTVGLQDRPSTSDGVDGLVVVFVVVVVLGAVVLIAWLLKPFAMRRLVGEDVTGSVEPGEPSSTAWPVRQDSATGPSGDAAVPRQDEPGGEIASHDIGNETPEETAEAEPQGITVEPAVADVSSIEEASSDSAGGPASTVDAEEIVGITLTVRELLEYANAGQLLRGFNLYSESYLRRFRAETGLTDEQFAEEYGSISAPPPEARIELAAVTEIDVLPDGRVSALISFGNGGAPPRPERFVFVRVAGRWLIDDIASAG